ncbi:hypothetical protein ACHQM5_000524 [Ranunculus cassubicifolius]
MTETDHKQLHVAAIAFPFGSHAAQVLNITRGLAAAAPPSVTFSFFSTAKSNLSLFGSSSCPGFDNIKVYDVDDGIPQNHVLSGNPMEEIGLFSKAAPHSLRKAIDKAVSDTNIKITCLTSDAFLPMTCSIAEELGVPWIPVFAPSASSLTCHVHTDLIRQMLEGKGDDELLSFVPGLESIRSRDLPHEILRNLDSPFGKMLHTMGSMISHATVVAINTFQELESDAINDLNSKLKLCLAVGPLTVVSPPSATTLEDPHGCLPWLDVQKPASVAYVSFGTSATPPPHELFALAQGLEASGVPFLWSLKDSLKVHLPDGFSNRTSARGKMVPWTPQTKILEHSALGVFVTHCGWNSVLESIMAGIPLIYRPFFGDQDLIARLASNVWEIGVDVDDGVFTKDGTVKALDLILCKKEGEKIKGNVAALKEKAKQAVGPTGSTSNNFKRFLEIVTNSPQIN